jgi:hypothetical protein
MLTSPILYEKLKSFVNHGVDDYEREYIARDHNPKIVFDEKQAGGAALDYTSPAEERRYEWYRRHRQN